MRARKAICLILFFICLLLGFDGIAKVNATYAAVSYRFSQPIKTNYPSKKATTDALSKAYWKESEALVTAKAKSHNATVIGVFGNPFLCYPMQFVSGGILGGQNMCAISDALAFRLFGSINVVGITVNIAATPYKISGVFKGAREIIVYAALPTDSFNSLEIEASLSKANEFLTGEGLPCPQYIIDTEVMRCIFTAIAYLPIWAATLSLIGSMFKAAHSKQGFVFLLLIAIACAAPLALNALPSFAVPAKWSDFAFYEGLLQNAKAAMYDWFKLPPFAKDVTAKYAMLQGTAFSLAATFACLRIVKRKIW